MMTGRIAPALVLIILLSIPHIYSTSEAGRGGPSTNVSFDISFEERTIDGTPYQRVLIGGGGIERADSGFEIPFLTIPLIVDGMIRSLSVRFSDGSTIGFEAAPWTVPLPDGSVIDPTYLPGSDLVRPEGYVLNDLGDGPSGSKLYSLKLYPVRYADGPTIVAFGQATIEVDTAPVFRSFTLPTERKPIGDIKYLIITDTDLVDSLVPLAEWKCQKGLFTKIVTVDEISAMYKGTDKAKKMRQYVMEMEQRYDLDYLLLAGDYDKVPTRAAYNDYPYPGYGEPSYYATDGYFACVDNGTTWNRDNDNYCAEPTEIDDPIPNMAVGRLAINSPTIMKDVVDALVSRDKTLPLGSVNDVPVYMAGDPASNPGYPPDTMDHFWETYGDDIFPDHETLYYDGTGSMSFGSNSFRTVVDDHHQYMCYFSHGDSTYIPGLFDRNDVQYLSGQAGVFFAMACLTAWFDQASGFTGDCLAEYLTEAPGKGFVGYIGSSRLAVGEIDTAYSGDAPGLEEDYWKGVRAAVNGDINATTGDIYRYAVTTFASSFYPFPGGMYDGSLRTYLEYNLLGEPDAPLITEAAGSLQMDFTVAPDRESVSASVLEGALPAAVVTVSVSKLGEIGRSAVTDSEGKVTIAIPPSNGGNVSITAYRRGYLPAQGYFELPDEIAPVSSITLSPAAPDGLNGFYRTDPSIAIDGDEEVIVQYGLNLDPYNTIPGGTPFTLSDGSWFLEYRVVDGAGLASVWANVTVKVDKVAPHLGISTTPALPDGKFDWFVSPVNITVGSDEQLYGVEVMLDDSGWFPISGLSPLTAGSHTVGVRATDEAGNMNQSWISLKVDSSAPKSSITISDPPNGKNGFYTIAPSIMLRTTDPNDPILYYSWDDDSTWIEYAGPFTAPEGIHTLLFRGKDAPGNLEQTHSYEFKVDSAPPKMKITTDPIDPDGLGSWYRTSPTIDVDFSEGALKYALVPEGVAPDMAIYGRAWYGPITIPDGNWSVSFLCTDAAGNEVKTGVYTYRVDTLLPTLSFDIWPAEPDGENGWYLTPPSIKATADPGSSIGYRLKGSQDYLPYKDLVSPDASEYIIEFKATDQAGNEIFNSTPTVRVDGGKPWVYVSDLREGQTVRNRTLNLSWEGGDNVPGYLEYFLRIDDGDFRLLGNVTYCILKDLLDGGHHFTVLVRDRAGNKAEAGMGFKVDATIPRALFYTPEGTDVRIGSSISVNFSEGMDRPTVRFAVQNVAGTLVWDSNRCIFVPETPLAYGRTYTVVVNGFDLNGNAMDTLSWEFTTEDDPADLEKEEGGSNMFLPIAGIVVLALIAAIALGIALYVRRRRDDDLEFFE
jgi:hypothetical protein